MFRRRSTSHQPRRTVAALLAISGGAVAQNGARPQFEIAAIKPPGPGLAKASDADCPPPDPSKLPSLPEPGKLPPSCGSLMTRHRALSGRRIPRRSPARIERRLWRARMRALQIAQSPHWVDARSAARRDPAGPQHHQHQQRGDCGQAQRVAPIDAGEIAPYQAIESN
jgi:hypothetical protein